MRKVFAVLIAIPVLAALVLAGVIAFGTPPMPEPMPRIAEFSPMWTCRTCPKGVG